MVDWGSGVARQLVFAGIALSRLHRVFVTHHHSDHNAALGNLLLLAWDSGLQTPVDIYGPPPIAEMFDLFLRLNAYDITTRIADEGQPPLAPLIRDHELRGPGLVLEDERVKVTATLINYPRVEPAFAYRFDTADRSIVIGGHHPSTNLVQLARGAAVLVREVMEPNALQPILARNPNAKSLLDHLLASHTTLEQVGRVATDAGAKTLVLSHFVPTDDSMMTDQRWLDGAKANFAGEVIVGRDLLEI